MKRYLLLIPLTVALVLASCKEIEGPVSPLQPEITLDRDEPIYRTKVGEPVEITPVVSHAGESPLYRWTIDGAVVSSEPSFTFVGVEKGSVYITFEVIADHGQADIEVRVDVSPLKFPTITMAVPPNGFSMLRGAKLELKPEVNNASESTFRWEVGGETVSGDKDYTFIGTALGEYMLKFTATNSDGTDFLEFPVRVCTAEQMSFKWCFEQETYNVALGRTVFIRPYHVENAFDAVYTWKVNGEAVEAPPVGSKYSGTTPVCILAFRPAAEGKHTVEVTMTNTYISVSKSFTVNCCRAEGAYKRPGGGGSSERWNKVYEFLAAPGQFVNENYTAGTMAEACAYAEKRLTEKAYVSLGAFGGYIVLGFDHSIDNDGGYNIQILGNSFSGSSEPGIVWVMQDENGDGEPNDTWYELKGSEYGRDDTWLDYAVTYYRPAQAAQPVSWSDNAGNTGQVDYLSAFHRQDYYYPLWADGDSYTLVGRRLEPRTEMISANYWVNHEFDWGYADNFSPVDRLTDDDNHNANVNGNHFRISNAVRYDGLPANLQYIDFIKIQTGVQVKAGWLGEISTEVFGANDYNMIK